MFMARSNNRYKSAYNLLLRSLEEAEPGTELPSETALAAQLGVSRTIVRTILARLVKARIVLWRGRVKRLLRRPEPADRFAESELKTSSRQLESQFLEWILRRDLAAEARLNVSEMARQFEVTPPAVHDFLVRFSRFGLVEQQRRGGWVLRGFTSSYAVELSDFRWMIELSAARKLIEMPPDHAIWGQLDELEADHHALLANIETDFHDFSALDDRFHTTINSVTDNRFVREFQGLISMIFHYHYQWNKKLERHRNQVAIGEHLDYIAGLRTRDWEKAEKAARIHLTTARQTLLDSIEASPD